jgi:antitoxin component YwqK of YwqJK toxin-antitoxin module
MGTIKEMYKEWQDLKNKSLSYQRAGIDDNMTDEMYQKHSAMRNRIEEIEKEMFPLLPDQERVVFDKTEATDAEEQLDRFYTNNCLIHWIKIKEEINVKDNLVDGEVVFAPIPK